MTSSRRDFCDSFACATGFLPSRSAVCQTKPRARDLGVPFDGTPGPNNAITDVKGVEVGHTTLISRRRQARRRGRPCPHRRYCRSAARQELDRRVFGAWFTLNGNGEMTGTTWLEDSGLLDGPMMITNTHSVGVVRDAVIAWKVKRGEPGYGRLLVVAAGGRGNLGRMAQRHQRISCQAGTCFPCARLRPRAARSKKATVGGGTGMVCNEFKGGIGTSSRVLDAKGRWLHGRRAGAMQLWTADQNCALPACRWARKFRSIRRMRTKRFLGRAG